MSNFFKSIAKTVILPWALTFIGGLIGKKLGGDQSAETKTPPAA